MSNRILLVVVFILSLAVRGSQAQEMRLLRFPAIHGDTVVFTHASDLWVATARAATPGV